MSATGAGCPVSLSPSMDVMMQQLLVKILWKGQRRRQLLWAITGLTLGSWMIMLAMAFYWQTATMLAPAKGRQEAYEYLILSKPVSALNSLNMLSDKWGSAFRERELDELRSQPFITNVSPVLTNTYRIESNLAQQLEMYADLFFEAVPDAFMDTLPPEWHWAAGDTFLPVIMTKDWLELYNFNVAMMYNLPQLSEESLMALEFDVIVSGNDQRTTFRSKVVGFSYRLPSLMVPYTFMEWANDKYGSGQPVVSRVIIATEDAADPRLKDYLTAKGLDANTEKTGRTSFRSIALSVAALTAIIGLLIAFLSVIIVMVTLQLLVSRRQPEIDILLQLGYRPGDITRLFLRRAAGLLLASLLAGLALFGASGYVLYSWLLQYGFTVQPATVIIAVVPGIALCTFALIPIGYALRQVITR